MKKKKKSFNSLRPLLMQTGVFRSGPHDYRARMLPLHHRPDLEIMNFEKNFFQDSLCERHPFWQTFYNNTVNRHNKTWLHWSGLKGEVHSKMQIQSLSPHHHADGGVGWRFVVHRTFLELHSTTASEHSTELLKQMGTCLKLKKQLDIKTYKWLCAAQMG